MQVDVVVLSREPGMLRREVQQSIARQTGVRTRLHRIIGMPKESDSCRWATIARARNQGKLLGSSPYFMFLDDDVVLAPDCIRTLLAELQRRGTHAAMAADYLGQCQRNVSSPHVGMGATLFRRSALNNIHFRWETDRCECQCCCDDLRAGGWEIAYAIAARAMHLQHHDRHAVRRRSRETAAPRKRHSHGERADRREPAGKCTEESRPAKHPADHLKPATILTAFDRRHFQKFRRRFLASLRASGNDEHVVAFAYGLYPSQQRMLANLRHVDVVAMSAGSASPSLQRLHDFQTVVAQLDEEAPVAHWDAGDVIFQGSLQPLWRKAVDCPDQLLVASEPVTHPRPAQTQWIDSIRDPDARREAWRLVMGRPVLQSGFVAGTAGTMLTYLRGADQLRQSVALAGTTDWGDQIALNLYCYAHKAKWCEVDQEWSYCLCARDPGEVLLDQDGRFVSRQGDVIRVVHGNARTLDSHPVFRLAAN